VTAHRLALQSTDALGAALGTSLGPWQPAAPRVLAALAQFGVGAEAMEASARWTPGQAATGLRMMLEGLQPDAARAVLACLPVPQQPLLALLRLAGSAPVIVGWDCSRSAPVAKMYLNLSDRSVAERSALAEQLGLPAALHVLGRNMSAQGVETKVYVQQDDMPPEAPDALHAFARQAGCAGVVLSHDWQPGQALQLRAVFVAPQQATRAQLTSLPGWEAARLDGAIPFAWEQVRSVGVAADGGAWVAYVKPAGASTALWQLEPALCLRGPQGELGVFVEPATAPRAYVYTASHALSYRVRQGAPPADAVAAVMRWAYAAVSAWEQAGQSGPVVWGPPPEGWDAVAR